MVWIIMEVKQCSNCTYYKPKLCLLFDELVEGYCRCFMHQYKKKKKVKRK